jgi:hypothetical protein
MADKATLVTRLTNKFSKVPNVTTDDIESWLDDAVLLHGVLTVEEVPESEVGAVLLLAQSVGCRSIALSVAHYFSYVDGDEQVDKTMLVTQYIAMANEFQSAYATYNPSTVTVGGISTRWTTIERADR